MQKLERSPQWQASSTLRQILALWPQLVGKAVAQHSQPTKIHRRALQVSVSSAAWAQTLTFERLKILQKLHQAIPPSQAEIQDLRFATAQWQRVTQRSQLTPSVNLAEHPSWATSPPRSARSRPEDVTTAFNQWATDKQRQLSSQSRCPSCHSPCPSQELQRWSICAICMTHKWQSEYQKSR